MRPSVVVLWSGFQSKPMHAWTPELAQPSWLVGSKIVPRVPPVPETPVHRQQETSLMSLSWQIIALSVPSRDRANPFCQSFIGFTSGSNVAHVASQPPADVHSHSAAELTPFPQ